MLLTSAFARADEVRYSLGIIGGYENSNVLETFGNPGNQVLKIPTSKEYLEVRPNLKWTSKWMEVVFRPRGLIERRQVEYRLSPQTLPQVPNNPSTIKNTESTQSSEFFLADAYFSQDLSEKISLTIGRQNYQWGPAEIMSPSNFIFHETVVDKKTFAETKGRNLLRLNITPTKSWSAVSLIEWAENNDIESFGADQKFHPAVLVKNEYGWNQGAEYVAVVVGAVQTTVGEDTTTTMRWGEMFNLQLPFWDGFSFYGDLGHQKGSAAWYPQTQPTKIGPPGGSWVRFNQSEAQSNRIFTTGVFGVRYDFVDGEIIRLEYAFDEKALSHSKRALSRQALQPQTQDGVISLPDNYRRFWNAGTDLKTPEVLFASLYAPDIANFKDLSGLVRWSYEPFEHSTWGYLSAQYQIGDSGTLSYGGILSTGSGGSHQDQPLRGTSSPSHTVAYRYDW